MAVDRKACTPRVLISNLYNTTSYGFNAAKAQYHLSHPAQATPDPWTIEARIHHLSRSFTASHISTVHPDTCKRHSSGNNHRSQLIIIKGARRIISIHHISSTRNNKHLNRSNRKSQPRLQTYYPTPLTSHYPDPMPTSHPLPPLPFHRILRKNICSTPSLPP